MRLGYKYLDSKEARVLYRHFAYYRKLSPVLKRIYENRVAHFMYSKDYMDADGNEVSEKKKILIAAYAAQFTFGLKNFHFEHFNKVTVFPSRFYSKRHGDFTTWEVDSEGSISLSWKDFYLGLKNKQSLSPIGLRIMANVVKIENERVEKHGLQLRLNKDDHISNDFQGALTGSLFTSQDMTNNDEFFVACLINFFDKPLEFRNRYPGLFRDIDQMLHRDVLKSAS